MEKVKRTCKREGGVSEEWSCGEGEALRCLQQGFFNAIRAGLGWGRMYRGGEAAATGEAQQLRWAEHTAALTSSGGPNMQNCPIAIRNSPNVKRPSAS